MKNLLLTYYGDDFTGSTDALESLTRAGARTVLFFDVPTAETLARYPNLDAVGVAGRTRSLAPDEMETELLPALAALRELAAPHVHYKVCSTFDSSPTVGSIGRVIDVATEMFDASLLPLVVGAPQLGRYCVFGNLFARLGIGTDAPPTRLDRLPSMQNHPVTPMRESDLRRHLAAQTDKPIGLFDVLQFSRPIDEQRASLERLLSDGTRVVLFDVLDAAHLSNIGALINGYASSARPVFTVGSSSVETALGAHWQEQGRLQARDEWKPPGSVRPILVVSGSCSPVTAGQIDWAVEHGFADVPLDTPRIAADESVDDDTNAVADTVVTQLRGGQSVVIHTSRGGDDPRIVAIGNASAQLFGTTLGRIVRRVLERHHLRRLCISGGDTSSYVARQLNIESLEMVAPLVPGAPLCRAKSAETAVDGLEVNVKGGQVGRSDYFAAVERGKQD